MYLSPAMGHITIHVTSGMPKRQKKLLLKQMILKKKNPFYFIEKKVDIFLKINKKHGLALKSLLWVLLYSFCVSLEDIDQILQFH